MKKILALTLVAMLMVCSLSGCASQNEFANKKQVTITLWHYYNGNTKDSFDSLVQKFNETVGKDKNILIDAYSYSGVNELADALVASADKEIGALPLPDIFAAYSDNAFMLDKKGIVAPLDDYFTKEELNKFNSDFLNEGRFDAEKTLKIIPTAKSTENLYVNATDFEAFAKATGADIKDMATWEGITQLAAKFYAYTDEKTPEPFDGKAMFGIDAVANFMVIGTKQLGSEIYANENGQVSFNLSREHAKKLWDVFYQSSLKGYFSAIGRFRSDDMKSGENIAYVGSTASAAYFPDSVETQKDAAYEIKCETMPYPCFEGGAKIAASQGAGMVVTKSDKAKEQSAVEFLKWFTDVPQNTAFAVATGYMPVQTAAMTFENIDTYIKNQPSVKEVVSQTAQITYNEMADYVLYTNIPFEKSFDARKLLENSLKDKISVDRETLANASSADRNAAIEQLCGEQNFEAWYTDLCLKMSEITK